VTRAPDHTFSPQSFSRFALIINLLILPIILTHQSVDGTVLSQYSPRYTAFIVGAIAITLFWGGLVALRDHLAPLLANVSSPLRYGTMLGAVGISIGIIAFIGVELKVESYLGINATLLVILLSLNLTGNVRARWWVAFVLIITISLLPLTFITHLTELPYHVDDAHWADGASNLWREGGGLYAPSWKQQPVLIWPGVGWIHALYGWLLVHVDFDISIGRIFRFVATCLTLIGTGWVISKLYNRYSGYLTIPLMLIVHPALMDGSYRPHMFATAAISYALLMIIIARRATGTRAIAAHVGVGLLVTFAMQLHAIAFGLALGVSVFYAGDFLWHVYQRNWDRWRVLVAYGGGAALGTAVYLLANVATIGGLDVYLSMLIDDRYHPERSLGWLFSPMIPRFVIVWGWAYLLWRRTADDRLLLTLLACIVAATVLIDTQGYDGHLMILLALPAGEAIRASLSAHSGKHTLSRTMIWGTCSLLLVFSALFLQREIDWDSVRYLAENGQLPEREIYAIGDAIRPYVNTGETIATTHELIWTFWEDYELVSFAAEHTVQEREGYDDPIRVWEQIAPDVIVDIPRRLVTNSGLDAYREQYFEECHRFRPRGYLVIISRPDCSDSPTPVADREES
jgi:hypothetical protein